VAEGDGPSFPVFRGKDLLLNNFSLSSWKEEILLPDLKKCRLSSCPDLTELGTGAGTTLSSQLSPKNSSRFAVPAEINCE
jgi:hypothetical protein